MLYLLAAAERFSLSSTKRVVALVSFTEFQAHGKARLIQRRSGNLLFLSES